MKNLISIPMPFVFFILFLPWTETYAQISKKTHFNFPSIKFSNLPPKLNHLLCLYTFQRDPVLQKLSFNDFAKLLPFNKNKKFRPHPSHIGAVQLMDTLDFGSKLGVIHQDQFHLKNLRESPVPMGNPKFLKNFLSFCRQTYPAHSYSLILQGHGQNILLEPDLNNHHDLLSIREIKTTLEELNLPLTFIGFDNCLMSSLETLYEIRNSAPFVLAFEDYCPNVGIVSEKLVPLLGQIHPQSSQDELRKILIDCAKPFSQFHKNKKGNCDISVIESNFIEPLADFLTDHPLRASNFQQDFCIDKTDAEVGFDLYQVIVQSINHSKKQKEKFKRLFKKTVPYYAANLAKINSLPDFPHHGISILGPINEKKLKKEEWGKVFVREYKKLELTKKLNPKNVSFSKP
jgi:hypothetical protein